MTHEGFPSLISLGISDSFPGENTALRRWMVGSMVFHLVLALLVFNVRFSPSFEQPLSSYEVSLIPSSDLDPPSRPKAKARPSRSKAKPVNRPKTKPVKPPPPLPTTPARERLSDSFADSVKTIVVPQARERETMTPYQASPMQAPSNQNDITKKQEVEPETMPIPDRVAKEPVPSKPTTDARPTTKELLQGIKAPPQTPNLTPLDPFQMNQETDPIQQPSDQLTDSFKETLQSVQIPTRPKRKNPNKTRQRPATTTPPPSRSVPPELANESPRKTKKEPTPVQRERLSDSLKQLLENVSVPKLRDIPPPADPPQNEIQETLESIQMPKITERASEPTREEVQPNPDPPESNNLRTEIDQQIAKLKIPDVVPIESLRQRLQIQEVAASESDKPLASASSANNKGNASRKSRYLALVKARIDQLWIAPQVAVEDKDLQAILQFRILRSGEVTNLQIERGSGNTYYDSAAQRAVQGADPLPSFPSEITETYLDVHFSFSLEEAMQ